MGVVVDAPLPTFPDGFPPERRRAPRAGTGARFSAAARQRHRGHRASWGEHHLRTGELILYTSADSVLQLAAHVDVLPEAELHAACAAARAA